MATVLSSAVGLSPVTLVIADMRGNAPYPTG